MRVFLGLMSSLIAATMVVNAAKDSEPKAVAIPYVRRGNTINLLLVGSRNRNKDGLSFPRGHMEVEDSGDLRETALRELREESKFFSLYLPMVFYFFFSWMDGNGQELRPIYCLQQAQCGIEGLHCTCFKANSLGTSR